MRASYSPPLSPEHFFFRTIALAAIVLAQACGTSPYHPAELAHVGEAHIKSGAPAARGRGEL